MKIYYTKLSGKMHRITTHIDNVKLCNNGDIFIHSLNLYISDEMIHSISIGQ